MEIRPLDLTQMATLNYDITTYQPILFAAESVDHLEDVVGTFFATSTTTCRNGSRPFRRPDRLAHRPRSGRRQAVGP